MDWHRAVAPMEGRAQGLDPDRPGSNLDQATCQSSVLTSVGLGFFLC